MNCELAHERIAIAAYAELPDDEVHELERHLNGCENCRNEREQVTALQVLASAYPLEEPDANLIARARLRLDEALDALPPRRWYERWGQRIRNGVAGLREAPVMTLLILALGTGAGGFGGYRLALQHHVPAPPAPAVAASLSNPTAPAGSQAVPNLASVAAVTLVAPRPNSEQVDVSYSQVVPHQLTGSLDDPAIRQLLMMGMENQSSARVRSESVRLLAHECQLGHSCQPSGIRDALIVALRYDPSSAVRQVALQGLEPYVAQDLRVRDAVLESLMTDSDPQIRATSISLLQPVEADTSVRQVLSSVSNSDENPHIRYVSRQILSQVPEIQ
jgi:anti-sigma factor RsiW